MRKIILNKLFKTIYIKKVFKKNYCSRFYKKDRKIFFNGLNPSFVTNNKLFWKTLKPFFSGKGNYGANIKLVEEGEVLQNDNNIVEKLNEFFKNAVFILGISKNSVIIMKNIKIFLTQFNVLLLNSNLIKLQMKIILKLNQCYLSDIELEIRLLNLRKAATHENIPPKILKSSSEAAVKVLHRLFTETKAKVVFPDNLKVADVTPVFKKDDPFDKKKIQTCQRFTDYI